ncbi:MAG: hypothetical protein JW759_07350 [Candidatus Coatesbacteria bacterium]|nr:hypothetical protein [Candidatus Coatesbacteria bacterium]
MGKKKKKVRATDIGTTAEAREGYSFGQLLTVNAIAWGSFLLITYILTKTFGAEGEYLLPFYSFLGIGVSIGTLIDYALENF